MKGHVVRAAENAAICGLGDAQRLIFDTAEGRAGESLREKLPLDQLGDQLMGGTELRCSDVGSKIVNKVAACVSRRHFRLSSITRLAYQSSGSGSGLVSCSGRITSSSFFVRRRITGPMVWPQVSSGEGVLVEQATEEVVPSDTVAESGGWNRFLRLVQTAGRNEVQGTVRPMAVVVADELTEDGFEMSTSEK